MHIDSHFSLSNSNLDDANYIIFGIPYDASQTFNIGSRFAPNSIRLASWNLEEYSMCFRYDLRRAKVFDAGNINCDGSFTDVVGRVGRFLKEIRAKPIALGGEHTVSYAIVNALNKKSDFRYLVFDAHFDLRDEFDSNKYSHACNLRRILDIGVEAMVVGVRSGCEEEVKFAESSGVEYVTPWDKDRISRIKEFVEGEKIYVSLDMDVFDPAFAPEVSTPEPFGIEPSDFLRFLSLLSNVEVVGLDVVEVVPKEVPSNTSVLAAKMVFEFIAAIESSKVGNSKIG